MRHTYRATYTVGSFNLNLYGEELNETMVNRIVLVGIGWVRAKSATTAARTRAGCGDEK